MAVAKVLAHRSARVDQGRGGIPSGQNQGRTLLLQAVVLPAPVEEILIMADGHSLGLWKAGQDLDCLWILPQTLFHIDMVKKRLKAAFS